MPHRLADHAAKLKVVMLPHRLVPPVAFGPVEHRPNGDVVRPSNVFHGRHIGGKNRKCLEKNYLPVFPIIHPLLERLFPCIIIRLG